MSPDNWKLENGKWKMGRRPFSILRFPFSMTAAAVMSLSGCEAVGRVFTDFKQQPKLDPWETPADTIAMRANPQGSVPITGSAAPGFAYGRGTLPGSIDSMSNIPNPVASDDRSKANGRLQYQINCTVCHGPLGAGNGPITTFGFPPMPIGAGSKSATQYSDGYLFGMIRNGRGLMPPYNRIEERDRWDLINYLRAVQAGGASAAGAAPGRPGQTGEFLPGISVTAPTRPAPHAKPPTP